MTLQLPLSPELETRLVERAAASGLDLNNYILRIISEELEAESDGVNGDRSIANRVAALHRWVEQQPDRPVIADDSRESIYEDRGA